MELTDSQDRAGINLSSFCLKAALLGLKLLVPWAYWGLVGGTGACFLSCCRLVTGLLVLASQALARLFKPGVCKQLLHYMKGRALGKKKEKKD